MFRRCSPGCYRAMSGGVCFAWTAHPPPHDGYTNKHTHRLSDNVCVPWQQLSFKITFFSVNHCCYFTELPKSAQSKMSKPHKHVHTDIVGGHLLTRVLMSASLSSSCVWKSVCCLRSSSTSSLSCESSSVCSPFTWAPASPWLLDWLWFSLPEIMNNKLSDLTGNVKRMLMF